VSEFVKSLLKHIIKQMPQPPNQTLSSHLTNTSNEVGQRSLFSSVAIGLWSVVTLGYGSSSAAVTLSANSEDTTFLPSIPSEGNGSASASSNDVQIDCGTRLLAWQSCHILLVLSNHCTNEILYNPYRLALFHFTDTQSSLNYQFLNFS
jgi:hypothetical protein